MLVAPARAPATRRLAVTLYGYAFLTDLVLLYPLYVLLFADTGLSVGQISSLFVLWSVAGILLEVPSGAWADALSRRLLLRLAPLLTAAGFALWVLLPSYPAFAVGFLLWGAGGALRSGALEALVFMELDHLGAADRYARLIGRARTAEVLGAVGSGVLAGPVFALGGYLAVGAASVLTCLLAAAVAARLPERRPRATPAPAPSGGGATGEQPPGWLDRVRGGLAEVRADRRVRASVLLVAAVATIWGGLDEYTGLLARDTGAAEATVPLLLLLLWGGMTAGGLLAPLGERLSDRGYAGLLVLAAAATAVGALLRHPAGFLLLALAFAAFQLATVLADVRLQARITGDARATVTSLAGMATDLTTVAFYGGYGLLAGAVGNPIAFAVAVLPYPLVALWLCPDRGVDRAKK
ncbi:MFS transporter [Micromonospora sp. WMMD998]|uniref:MFS transporter n=1 Tax=Micromonospora sp. WMMD998 TaxID=3016092 RepID=UPI00249CE8B8|nr:MFS transporter [Micromonospora sp. WMMD998]WFE40461.1 MFS transporter [Micromonospora sp. WMMD998]